MAELTNEQLNAIMAIGSQTLASMESRRALMRAAISADRAVARNTGEALAALETLRSALHDGYPQEFATLRAALLGELASKFGGFSSPNRASNSPPLSDVECWEQGKPDSIDRAMAAEAAQRKPDLSGCEVMVDGEGVSLESGKPFGFTCCDCGLTHRCVIVSEDGKPVGFAIERDQQSTAERRPGAGIVATCWVPMNGAQLDLESIAWDDEDCTTLTPGWEYHRAALVLADGAMEADGWAKAQRLYEAAPMEGERPAWDSLSTEARQYWLRIATHGVPPCGEAQQKGGE